MPTANRQPQYFDYPQVATEARISDADLTVIEAHVRNDYPTDLMMFELRMLRICEAIKARDATVADALRPDTDARSSGQAAA